MRSHSGLRGHRHGEAIAHRVAGFNSDGVATIAPGPGSSPEPAYAPEQHEGVRASARPCRKQDGTAIYQHSASQGGLGAAATPASGPKRAVYPARGSGTAADAADRGHPTWSQGG